MSIPVGLTPSPFQKRVNPELTENDFISVCDQAVPLWLTNPEKEYQAFRNTAGMIDFSMLLKWEITGPTATAVVNSVFSRNVTAMADGSIAYGVVVSSQGKMLDDVTVLRYSENHYLVNGANTAIHEVIISYLGENTLEEVRSKFATLSLQGPLSREILQSLTTADVSNESFSYYTFKVNIDVAGIPAQINRIGFTAELGFEIMVPINRALDLWDAVAKAGAPFGVTPCGAIALMTVRVEAGMIMAELEYNEHTSPYECRMGWSVDLEKGAFHGREALVALKHEAASTIQSIIIDAEANGLDRCEIVVDDKCVGAVTMAVASPVLDGKTLALAKLSKGIGAGSDVEIIAPTGRHAAQVVATPVYDPDRKKVRS